MLKGGDFHYHGQASGRRLTLQRPLGPSRLAARYREATPEVSEPTKEVAKLDPAPAIEEKAVALNKGARSKAEGPKVHIGFRLAKDVVESLKASGPGYNARVEEALRAAGFGAKAPGAKKRAAGQSNFLSRV
jgi:uncharacterized protein (DUF4415 family)